MTGEDHRNYWIIASRRWKEIKGWLNTTIGSNKWEIKQRKPTELGDDQGSSVWWSRSRGLRQRWWKTKKPTGSAEENTRKSPKFAETDSQDSEDSYIDENILRNMGISRKNINKYHLKRTQTITMKNNNVSGKSTLWPK